jgi:chitin disaccharide deacetylase
VNDKTDPGNRTLIVNADDFGFTPGVTRGILAAHDDGLVTSTTAMATGVGIEDALAEARRRPALGVGVHITLCDTPPAAPTSAVRSLLDPDTGRFPSLGGMTLRFATRRVRLRELTTEIKAQIGRIVDAGVQPTHIDTHRHVVVLPGVLDAIIEAARPFGLRAIRRPLERNGWRNSGIPALLKYGILAPITWRLGQRALSAGFRSPNEFWGISAMGQPDFAERLSQAICELTPGVTEFMVHPGEPDAELKRIDTYLEPRQFELQALRDPRLRALCQDLGVRLATYAVLAA